MVLRSRGHAGMLHARETRSGHFWQGRFSCVALLDGLGDGLTDVAALGDRVGWLASQLAAGENEALSTALRRAESIGRPLGDDRVMARIAELTSRDARPRRRGPKPKVGEIGALSP
jgi:putative transposase